MRRKRRLKNKNGVSSHLVDLELRHGVALPLLVNLLRVFGDAILFSVGTVQNDHRLPRQALDKHKKRTSIICQDRPRIKFKKA
jgi:hypothetical protein